MKLPGGPKPLPRVLCRGWRNPGGFRIRCVVGHVQAGEPGGEEIEGGQCSTCAPLEKMADEIRAARAARGVERRAKQPHEVRPMTDADWESLK